jgi:hypothetical protein
MEKVRECGLVSSRELTPQVGKVGGEDERVETMHPVSRVVGGKANSMMNGLQDADTRWQRRAAARQGNFDVKSLLRRI